MAIINKLVKDEKQSSPNGNNFCMLVPESTNENNDKKASANTSNVNWDIIYSIPERVEGKCLLNKDNLQKYKDMLKDYGYINSKRITLNIPTPNKFKIIKLKTEEQIQDIIQTLNKANYSKGIGYKTAKANKPAPCKEYEEDNEYITYNGHSYSVSVPAVLIKQGKETSKNKYFDSYEEAKKYRDEIRKYYNRKSFKFKNGKRSHVKRMRTNNMMFEQTKLNLLNEVKLNNASSKTESAIIINNIPPINVAKEIPTGYIALDQNRKWHWFISDDIKIERVGDKKIWTSKKSGRDSYRCIALEGISTEWSWKQPLKCTGDTKSTTFVIKDLLEVVLQWTTKEERQRVYEAFLNNALSDDKMEDILNDALSQILNFENKCEDQQITHPDNQDMREQNMEKLILDEGEQEQENTDIEEMTEITEDIKNTNAGETKMESNNTEDTTETEGKDKGIYLLNNDTNTFSKLDGATELEILKEIVKMNTTNITVLLEKDGKYEKGNLFVGMKK